MAIFSIADSLIEEGIEKGLKQGVTKGELTKLISLICKKQSKGKSLETIAEEVEETEALVDTICRAAAEFAPDYDIEKIYNKLCKIENV